MSIGHLFTPRDLTIIERVFLRGIKVTPDAPLRAELIGLVTKVQNAKRRLRQPAKRVA